MLALSIQLPIWYLDLNVLWMLQTECVWRELTSSVSKPASAQVHSSTQKLKPETWESLWHLPFSPSPPSCKLLTSLVNSMSRIVTESSIFNYQPCYTILSCLDHCDSIQICVPTFTLVMLQSKFLIAVSILLLKWKFYFALMQRTWLFLFSILALVPNINKAQSKW